MDPSPPRLPVISEEDEDRVGLAFRSIAMAVLVGVGVVGIALWVVATLMLDAPPSETPATEGPAFLVLMAGTMGGIGLAAATAWVLLAPVKSLYRRGTLAVVSGFATAAGMLVTMPANHYFGRVGVLVVVVVCGIGVVILSRGLTGHGTTR